ncbi:uncharacterized protein DUF3240 [Sulfuritortus calidifontis]|uniref:Uncharacterized protein DUF3240 n=1 Tax=Sulfuritortus calidifontis TaxID=1914471 RepID=A0A4R3JU85_9PROT|nr:DUF3240 family protein [Sulfuritortus calidifontis]TCS70016.1 uncharacterized protein DUF3240 [Sulfuritortus calidifontis]
MNLVLLTLVAPRALEEELLEQLLIHPEWASGFTLSQVEGHSQRGASLSIQEQVRGRAGRVALQIVLEAEQAERLLGHLKARFPKPDVAYWLTPVSDFGRLA